MTFRVLKSLLLPCLPFFFNKNKNVRMGIKIQSNRKAAEERRRKRSIRSGLIKNVHPGNFPNQTKTQDLWNASAPPRLTSIKQQLLSFI